MRIAKDVVDRLKFDNKTKAEIVDLVMYHDSDIYAAERPVRRWLNKIGFEMLDKLICVKLADIGAHSEIGQFDRVQRYYKIHDIAAKIMSEQQCFQIKDLAINGHDVIGIGVEAGPAVGKVLNHLLDRVLDEDILNEHDALIEEAERYLKGDLCSNCMRWHSKPTLATDS
jgi:tRNA nucleotidyltransferase (CCA-adding enzyme)